MTVNKSLRIGLITMIVAFMLAIMPLPDWAVELRPEWVTLVLIYWAMTAPSKIGITAAWFTGLLLDVSYGTLMGQHAIGMVLVIYVIHLQHQRLLMASLLQQAIVIFALLFIKQLLILWVDGMLGRAPDSWLYFMPTITSTILWPWIYIILKDLQRKYAASNPYQY
ncbi:MAG: rod shape-determining protein MreD [Gammaproteobacteria bacterium]|jgi:rod shape-determining protein MreD|nr:rod shape-determining protein MreD [Gammaproteobacteria bacterium]